MASAEDCLLEAPTLASTPQLRRDTDHRVTLPPGALELQGAHGCASLSRFPLCEWRLL